MRNLCNDTMLKLQSRKDRDERRSNDWRSYLRLMKYSMTITTRVMVYLTIARVSISFLNLLNHCFSTIKRFFMISLPIRLSKKYQVKQVKHEIGKKHYRETTYNNPNVQIKTIEPYIYLFNHLFPITKIIKKRIDSCKWYPEP